MSRPITMSFRPNALDLCRDGRKTETRRICKPDWRPATSFTSGVVRSIEDTSYAIPRILWKVGESIGLKRTRTGKVEARVLCTGLRVERVQDITEEDARAEGITLLPCLVEKPDTRFFIPKIQKCFYNGSVPYATARAAYEAVWRRLYPRGPNAWEKNPMVVVISFEPMEETP